MSNDAADPPRMPPAPSFVHPAEWQAAHAAALEQSAPHRAAQAQEEFAYGFKSRTRSFRERATKALAPLAGFGALLAKFGALLIKLKSLTLLGSIAVSVVAYALFWGWKFAVGFVLLIFVHEMGHVIVLRSRGIKAGWPVFVPFLGAFVSMQSQPRSAYEEAESAIAGPITGTAGAFVVGYIGHSMGSELLLALAYTGFLINLFNLLPALPLDGGRVAGALHPVIWLLGLVALVGVEFYRPSGIIIIILILGARELYSRWRNRNSEASKVYFALQPVQRIRIGATYLALIAVILIGLHWTYAERHIR